MIKNASLNIQTTNAPKKKNRTFVIMLIVIGALFLILLGFFIWKKIKDKRAIDEANKNLELENPAPKNNNSKPSEEEPEDISWPLKIGSTGNRVKVVQQALNKYKGTKLKEDGVFGQATYLEIISKVGTRFYPLTAENVPEFLKLVKT